MKTTTKTKQQTPEQINKILASLKRGDVVRIVAFKDYDYIVIFEKHNHQGSFDARYFSLDTKGKPFHLVTSGTFVGITYIRKLTGKAIPKYVRAILEEEEKKNDKLS